MLTYEARSAATPEAAWELVAEPARWHEWAPHVRGAWGLGEPEVRTGARGCVRLLGVVPVPASVTAKRPGRAWTWQVGPVELVHRVERRGRGSLVAVDLHAPAWMEVGLRATYGPLVAVLIRNLARVAERA